MALQSTRRGPWLPSTPMADVPSRVTAEAGLVDLRGTVDHIEQSEACSDITKRIKGVKVLENHLHIAETGKPSYE